MKLESDIVNCKYYPTPTPSYHKICRCISSYRRALYDEPVRPPSAEPCTTSRLGRPQPAPAPGPGPLFLTDKQHDFTRP